MDQFYWYVDEDTMIGYQSPVALVAIKPERIVGEPKVFWDYGFVPEAAPTLSAHFITDSDDFFMIEPQNRNHQASLIRAGWVPVDDLARTESLRATKEHRESLKQLIKIHSGDLPADMPEFVEESRAFMAEISARLSPDPAPHMGHPVFGWWNNSSLAIAALRNLQRFYRRTFGSPPEVGKSHPLWIETVLATRSIAAWGNGGRANILSTSSGDWLRRRPRDSSRDANMPYFDGCVCELMFDELEHLDALYAELRPLIKDGGRVLFKVANPARSLDDTSLFLRRCRFPDIDVSEMRFYGTLTTTLLHAVYWPALRPIPSRPIIRALGVCALIILAPLVRLANTRAERRNPGIFSPNWGVMTLEFIVKHRRQRLASVPVLDTASPKPVEAAQ
jgi:hypothetical protein